MTVAFCRPLQQGDSGADVVAHKRALSRWNPHVYPWGTFTDFYGPHFTTAVKEFQQQNGIAATGSLGQRTHDELVAAKAAKGGPAFDARAADLTAEFCSAYAKTPDEKARDLIVAAAFFWYSNRSAIAYSQARPFPLLKPPVVPHRWDCSAFATSCHYAGGAPDPNGRGYDGEGYTGTLIAHGTRVGNVGELKPGDLIFYGYTRHSVPGFHVGDPTHVAVYVGKVDGVDSVVSNGHHPMGLYPWNYRSLNHLRHYEVAA